MTDVLTAAEVVAMVKRTAASRAGVHCSECDGGGVRFAIDESDSEVEYACEECEGDGVLPATVDLPALAVSHEELRALLARAETLITEAKTSEWDDESGVACTYYQWIEKVTQFLDEIESLKLEKK